MSNQDRRTIVEQILKKPIEHFGRERLTNRLRSHGILVLHDFVGLKVGDVRGWFQEKPPLFSMSTFLRGLASRGLLVAQADASDDQFVIQEQPASSNPPSPLLLPSEVDDLLRLPDGKAARLAKRGKLPCVKLPDGSIRFRQCDIHALMVPA